MIHLKEVLNADELARIHRVLVDAVWQSGRDDAGAQAIALKNNEQIAHDSAEGKEIAAIVLAALDRHPDFFSAALPRRVFPPRVNRYAGRSNAFGKHIDNAIRVSPHTREHLRTDLSCTLFFASPESYDGGELVVHGTGPSVSPGGIKLPAGDALLYPASTVHEVRPVTRGSRLACFFWIESMIRGGEQRQMLHTLDNTIMGLRAANGDNEHTVALTGHYHNLLRMWADV